MSPRATTNFLEQASIFDFQVDELDDANGRDDVLLVERVEVATQALDGRARPQHVLLHLVLRVYGVEERVRLACDLVRYLSLDYVQIVAELSKI